MSEVDTAAIRARHERAVQHVLDLNDPKKPSVRWTMRVPAEPDRDSDLVLLAALDDIPRLLDALDPAPVPVDQRCAHDYDDGDVRLCGQTRNAAIHWVDTLLGHPFEERRAEKCRYTNTGWPEECGMYPNDPRHTSHLDGYHDSIECHPFQLMGALGHPETEECRTGVCGECMVGTPIV